LHECAMATGGLARREVRVAGYGAVPAAPIWWVGRAEESRSSPSRRVFTPCIMATGFLGRTRARDRAGFGSTPPSGRLSGSWFQSQREVKCHRTTSTATPRVFTGESTLANGLYSCSSSAARLNLFFFCGKLGSIIDGVVRRLYRVVGHHQGGCNLVKLNDGALDHIHLPKANLDSHVTQNSIAVFHSI
jgi:hypothetical protein